MRLLQGGERTVLSAAIVAFMGDLGKGFSASAFANRFGRKEEWFGNN